MSESFDRTVRHHVYDSAMRSGTLPSARDIADATESAVDDVLQSLRRLADARIFVLQRDGEILMANPFSAVPTPFVVETSRFSAFANCIWDALGVPAMLGGDARITASCGDCGTAAEVLVENDAVRGEGLVHFAIPARNWWKDIVFT
jgi:hypothetical protein